jgi:very-short-patch-repair endonuclease
MRYNAVALIVTLFSFEVKNMSTPRKNIDLDNAIKDYFSGFSFEDLARKYGLSGERIKARFVEAGVTLRTKAEVIALSAKKRRSFSPEEEASIIGAYQAGESCLSIADRLGTSRVPISAILKRGGVDIRGGSEANLLRMSRLSSEERRSLASAAHDAVRGKKRSFVAKVKNAIAKQTTLSGASVTEEMVICDLKSCLIHPIPQLAVGPYNCDLACHPVAVEIFGGQWHFSGRHLSRTHERIKYFGNAGWHVLMVVIDESRNNYRYGLDTGNYIVSYVNEARANPSAPREYRVIDCRGNTLAAGCCDDSEISIVPAFTGRRDPATGRYERVPR